MTTALKSGATGMQAMQPNRWRSREEAELSTASLKALLANEIPAIRIRDFATPAECVSFAKAVSEAELSYYSVARKIGYIGLAQYEYRWNRPKSDYFRDVLPVERKRDMVQAKSFNALHRFVDILGRYNAAGVDIASEALGHYFAGVIRNASEGVDLHVDYAPINSPAYSIAAIDAQLGWNFYAQGLVSGGETTVYNVPWNPRFEPGEIPQSYNLPRDAIEGGESFTFRPSVGDVVIFNTRNPHEIAGGVSGPGHDRISIGSFVGRMPSGQLVLWS